MRTSYRSRRHRNPQQHDESQREQPFFAKASQVERRPFFAAPSPAAAVQAKLAIGQPGDKYEREADAVAARVVSGEAQKPVGRPGISAVQRVSLATPQEDERLGTAEARMEKDKLVQEKPVQLQTGPTGTAENEEEPVQMQAAGKQAMPTNEEEEPVQMRASSAEATAEKEEEPVQMKARSAEAVEEEREPVQMRSGPTGAVPDKEEKLQSKAHPASRRVQRDAESGAPTASRNLSHRLQDSAGRGKPLPGKTRASMERAFGADFGGVHIHTDLEAVEMNQELGAQAFTRGQDVYFDSGKYHPDDSTGKRLLAHELTHVVQQGGGERRSKVQKSQLGGLVQTPRSHFRYELDDVISTYSALANHYGLSIGQIAGANPGINARRLRLGQALTVPANNVPTQALPTGDLAAKTVMSPQTVPLSFLWNSGSGSNRVGRISRGETVSVSGSMTVVLRSQLTGIAQGVWNYLESIGAATASRVAGYLPPENLRDAPHTTTSDEIDLISRMIWGEQRSQGTEAMVGAAWIVKNRFNAGWGTIAQIVNGRQFHGIASPASVRGLSGPDLRRWNEAQTISRDVMNGTLGDNTSGHVYFGNGESVRRRMESCRARNAQFAFGSISNTNFFHSNGDFTSNDCQIR